MTVYNVHIYREMRLYFPGIDAASPEEAAKVAADRLTDEAECVEDCDGENLAALVDVAGDDQFAGSVTIDFEPEQQRKAMPELLAALDYLLEQTVDMDLKYGIGLSEGEEDARAKALIAIANAPAEKTRQDEVMTPGNQRRAMRIGHVLTWCKDWNTSRDGLIELLADARHWCDQHGENFAALDRIAYTHYLAELEP